MINKETLFQNRETMKRVEGKQDDNREVMTINKETLTTNRESIKRVEVGAYIAHRTRTHTHIHPLTHAHNLPHLPTHTHTQAHIPRTPTHSLPLSLYLQAKVDDLARLMSGVALQVARAELAEVKKTAKK